MTDRARRTYLCAMTLGPLVLAIMGVLALARSRDNVLLPALGSFAVAVVFFLVGYSLRNSPLRWSRVAAISGIVAGVYSALMFLAWGDEDRLLVAGAVFVVLALVPWLVVRNASAGVQATPKRELVETGVELSFALRDETNGWFLIRHDEIAVRTRRKHRRNLDDNHDDRTWLGAITDVEVLDLPGGEETEIGLGYTLTPSAGPALRVRFAEEDIREDEWIVPIEEAWQAAEALRARMAQASSK
jgi:hypothetical protein